MAIPQPRLPCDKLGTRFGRADMIKEVPGELANGLLFAVPKEAMVNCSMGSLVRKTILLVFFNQMSSVLRLYGWGAVTKPDRTA